MCRYYSTAGLRAALGLSDTEVVEVNEILNSQFLGNTDFDWVIWSAPRLGTDLIWDRLLLSNDYSKWRNKTAVFGAEGQGLEAAYSSELLAVLKKWAEAGKLTVASEMSQQRLESALEKEVLLTGPPSLYLKEQSLQASLPPRVFCPPLTGRKQDLSEKELVSRFYQALNAQEETVFLAHHQDELALGASPGLNTLYSPNFPSCHGILISSAKAVVSGRSEPLMVALANGVPAVALSVSENAEVNRFEQVPQVSLRPNSDPRQAVDSWQAVVDDYPSDEVQTWVRARQKEGGLFLARLRDAKKESKTGSRQNRALHVCSISDYQYAPFLYGFIANLDRVHGDNVTFHLLCLDEKVAEELTSLKHPRLVLYRLSDLWEESELKLIRTRGIGPQAFASKARLLEKALIAAKAPVYYCDSDIYFFRSPMAMEEEFSRSESVLLFPHWNDEFKCARTDGLYNAGMVGAAPGAERFLNWWAALCLYRSDIEHEIGVVGDQAYLDYAPVLFPEVKIYRRGDQNVARWNLSSLKVEFQPEKNEIPLLSRQREVQSYHAAFVDSLGIFEFKSVWDQLVARLLPFPDLNERSAFFKTVLVQQQRHWLGLSRAIVAQRTVRRMIPWAKSEYQQKRCEFWMSPLGKVLMPGAFLLHSVLKLILDKKDAPDPHQKFWTEFQSKYIDQLELPPQVPQKRKAG